MAERDAAPSLEEIPPEECLELLAAFGVGRFAVAIPGHAPLVVPVNYVLDDDVIVFRSDYGSKIAGLRRRQVSFQVDLIDPAHRTGWSVLVQGIAHEATDDEVAHLVVTPWVGERDHWIRIVPTVISGRRIQLPAITADTRGYL
jgi:nitroimidazol reductase NimA-like FMN-containing flavoprotein (pyridoxamine 5'-phosphate oxidase superfamily)